MADAAARAAGITASSMVALQEAPAWLTAPPRPAPPVLMPPRLTGGAEELRAEGSGQEILLQVRGRSSGLRHYQHAGVF